MPQIHKLSARRRSRAIEQTTPPQRPPFEPIMDFRSWARSKSISLTTAKRLRRAGKIKTVQLSANRVGVTASADREFMANLESA